MELTREASNSGISELSVKGERLLGNMLYLGLISVVANCQKVAPGDAECSPFCPLFERRG